MENTVKGVCSSRIKGFFLREAPPFSSKQEFNWERIRNVGVFGVTIFVLFILLLPDTPVEDAEFHEKALTGDVAKEPLSATPTEDTLVQLQKASGFSRSAPGSLAPYYYRSHNGGSGSGPGSSPNSNRDRNASMIISPDKGYAKGKLPLGSRIVFRINGAMTVTSRALPLVGVVVKDTIYENSLAVPEGAKLYGEVSFDDTTERANITFQTIIFPNGRERPISGIAIGADARIGLQGEVHSKAIRNVIGHTITRLVGAYAEGSISKGPLGASTGGHENGLRNAVSETAKDYTEGFGEALKKEEKWIELAEGTVAEVSLNQPFVFRDPGGISGF